MYQKSTTLKSADLHLGLCPEHVTGHLITKNVICRTINPVCREFVIAQGTTSCTRTACFYFHPCIYFHVFVICSQKHTTTANLSLSVLSLCVLNVTVNVCRSLSQPQSIRQSLVAAQLLLVIFFPIGLLLGILSVPIKPLHVVCNNKIANDSTIVICTLNCFSLICSN